CPWCSSSVSLFSFWRPRYSPTIHPRALWAGANHSPTEARDMAAPQWLRLLIGTVVIAAYASPGSAAESDWPCIQHKVDKLSSAQMWDGSPVESLTEWRGDPAIKKL